MNSIIISIIILCIGIYCILSKKNLIKTIAGLLICQNALILFYIALSKEGLNLNLIITILLGMLAATAILSVLAFKLFEKFNTYDLNEIRDLEG